MKTPEPKDWVDDLLVGTSPVVKDDGFTARTMANLPRGRRVPLWVRPVVLTGLPALLAAMLFVNFGGQCLPAMGTDLLHWEQALCACPMAVLIAVCSLFAVSFTEAVAEA